MEVRNNTKNRVIPFLARVGFGCGAVCVLPGLAAAQTGATATVSGTVTDLTGAAVPGAVIVVHMWTMVVIAQWRALPVETTR